MSETAEAQFKSGYAEFNEGHYFEAHELWENLWRSTAADDSENKQFYHACIQLAVALYHHNNRNSTGAHNLLRKSLSRFEAISHLERFKFFDKHIQEATSNILQIVG